MSAVALLVVLSSGARAQDTTAAKVHDSTAAKAPQAAGATGQAANPLSGTYSVQLGDVAAASLSEMIKLRTDFDPAII
ncbi:MAG TPA: hypothetical protein VFV90_13360, partial [Usitatibacter sp.]|nr:hypothetical protein [Usitatibacter sp.]